MSETEADELSRGREIFQQKNTCDDNEIECFIIRLNILIMTKQFEQKFNLDPKPKFDSENNPIITHGPDEMDSDYVQPEEKSGIIGSGKDQMSEEEFQKFVSKSKE